MRYANIKITTVCMFWQGTEDLSKNVQNIYACNIFSYTRNVVLCWMLLYFFCYCKGKCIPIWYIESSLWNVFGTPKSVDILHKRLVHIFGIYYSPHTAQDLVLLSASTLLSDHDSVGSFSSFVFVRLFCPNPWISRLWFYDFVTQCLFCIKRFMQDQVMFYIQWII